MTPSPRLPYSSIADFHEALSQRKTSVTATVARYLESAQASQMNAYLTFCEKEAIAQAKDLDALFERLGSKVFETHSLFGVPFACKDILTTAGIRTTAGSRMLESYIPPHTATSVQRAQEAGAVLIGKTNLDEFAMGSSNENSAFGPVQHPTHPDRVPGGSSGGSASAVKAGLCLAALGTDTGGSIRLPASYCGLVGLKPSYGRVSRYGQIAYGSSLDQTGPLTLRVRDAALILDAITGGDPRDTSAAPLPCTQVRSVFEGALEQIQQAPLHWASGFRIGVPKEFFSKGLQREVEETFQQTIEVLKKAGAEIVSLSLPHLPYAIAVYYLIAVSEAASNLSRFDGIRFGYQSPVEANSQLADFYCKNRSLFGPEVKRRIVLGTFALSSGYQEAYFLKACQVRRKIREDFLKAFEQVDVILGPVAPTTAFRRGENSQDPLQMYLNDIYTVPANLAGLPALSLPLGKDVEGLPIGLQMLAPAFEEGTLFRLAAGLENLEFL